MRGDFIFSLRIIDYNRKWFIMKNKQKNDRLKIRIEILRIIKYFLLEVQNKKIIDFIECLIYLKNSIKLDEILRIVLAYDFRWKKVQFIYNK
ncbi:hypothetical protein BpHYR1_045514 [Brachionus plicatilis]|uniref:Uncharacterized protein n=1 Tax=Brachionus plicatilis TaxID=10195 RepID=A0A3M7SG74_BRAPC|nr:hypothetical protein BpHYR1_045514 [Brachionus plicatilis]